MHSSPQGETRGETPQEFARRLNLPFSEHRLLVRALTHRSYRNEHPDALEDNERLEFLGDAVLDFLVGAWLYNHFPEMAEGELTRLRSALVCTEQLAEFARQVNLGPVIFLGRGEEDNGGRRRTSMLCGAFEALVGALYLNSGFEAVRNFIDPLLQPAVEKFLATRLDRDPKSILQEYVQGHGLGSPLYITIATSGPEHEKEFKVDVLVNQQVYGSGIGSSKQAAAKNAARSALKTLGIG